MGPPKLDIVVQDDERIASEAAMAPGRSWVSGFRDLGFRDLGFRDLGFRALGFRDLGFRALTPGVPLCHPHNSPSPPYNPL